MKILFIGNSHTFTHYVPLRVKAFLEDNGETAEIVMLSHPGMGLDWHLQQSQTYFNLLYGEYDAVVLQHNAHPFPGKDSLLKAGQEMAKLISDRTAIYLYMTWSEKNNPQGQQIMSESYEELGKLINGKVCPVGKIWWQIKERYPDELYLADGEHASLFGASLAAAIIGSTIVGRKIENETIYTEAKKLEQLHCDGRLIDLVYENGQYGMRPLKDS